MDDRDKPKRPPRSPGRTKGKVIPWAEIRAAYESGETKNIVALAKRFGVSRNALSAHRRDEQWSDSAQTKEQIAEAARSNVIDIVTGKAIEKLGGKAALEQDAAEIADLYTAAQDLRADAALLLKKTFTRALALGKKDEQGKPVADQLILGERQGETTAVSDLLNAMHKFTQDYRLDAGLKDGTPTTDAMKAGDEEAKRVDQAILVVRAPAKIA